ncbi:MAG: MBL fold metallo-hydrolase [Gemmatimonadaceae bacterium]
MMEITEFRDVRRVRLWTWRTRAAGYDVSAYLLRGVLVDTGFPQVANELVRAVHALQPRGAIVTHWHEDHAGNAPALARAGLPLWMADFTERKLREREQVKLYRHVVWGRPPALRQDYARLDPGPLRIIATPGHSADHHIVFDPETATLISGDLWLGVKVRVMGYGENPYEIIASLGMAIGLRPERMFDAHRGLVDHPVASLEAKRAWLQDTVGEVERRLAAGQSDQDILREVLDGEERMALVSQGEYSRRNLVRAVKTFSPRFSAGPR